MSQKRRIRIQGGAATASLLCLRHPAVELAALHWTARLDQQQQLAEGVAKERASGRPGRRALMPKAQAQLLLQSQAAQCLRLTPTR